EGTSFVEPPFPAKVANATLANKAHIVLSLRDAGVLARKSGANEVTPDGNKESAAIKLLSKKDLLEMRSERLKKASPNELPTDDLVATSRAELLVPRWEQMMDFRYSLTASHVAFLVSVFIAALGTVIVGPAEDRPMRLAAVVAFAVLLFVVDQFALRRQRV